MTYSGNIAREYSWNMPRAIFVTYFMYMSHIFCISTFDDYFVMNKSGHIQEILHMNIRVPIDILLKFCWLIPYIFMTYFMNIDDIFVTYVRNLQGMRRVPLSTFLIGVYTRNIHQCWQPHIFNKWGEASTWILCMLQFTDTIP